MIKVEVVEWIIPSFRSNHCMPHGKLKVTNGVETKICKTMGDLVTDTTGYQYITFNKKRYKVINVGRLYFPKIKLELVV